MTLRLVVFVLFCCQLSFGQTPYQYTQPIKRQDGWPTADLRTKQIDTSRIYQLFNQLDPREHKLHSMLLIQGGDLILEEYFNSFGPDTLQDLRSVTKSVRSLLLGIAIDQGYIEHVNDPISKYLDQPVATKNLDPRKEKITIAHLLTMSSGLDCNDWDEKSLGQEDRVYKKKDWLQYTMNLPMINDPGTVSNYCSMGSILISKIIEQVSGMRIDEFAKKNLFEPLGITSSTWGHTNKNEVISAGWRLYMTPRDLAKIGQLVLNNGTWKDRQVVSEQWISISTTTQTTITDMNYGYFWWQIPFKSTNSYYSSIAATGNGGQYIMIFPELDLIAVFTGGAYNSPKAQLAFPIVQDVILPSLKLAQD